MSTPSLRFNVYLKDLRGAAGKVDFGTYLASLFLHYMSTYRPGKRINAVDLLKNTPYLSSRVGYLSSFVSEHFADGSEAVSLGKEYDNYVRFLFEGSAANFNIFNQDKSPDS